MHRGGTDVATALIALGGNGDADPAHIVERLDDALGQLGDVGQVQASGFFRTPAFPAGSGPDFINAAACLETGAGPEDLLARLHRIEAGHDRTREVRWGQRTLDLDLIALGNEVRPGVRTLRHWIDLPPERQAVESPRELILPHPRVQDRAFVLVPLAQVAPDWRHPVLGLSVVEMRDALPQADLDAVKPFARERR